MKVKNSFFEWALKCEIVKRCLCNSMQPNEHKHGFLYERKYKKNIKTLLPGTKRRIHNYCVKHLNKTMVVNSDPLAYI